MTTSGTQRPPVLPRIADYLDYHSARQPQAEAMVHGTRRWTWAELTAEVDTLARALLAAGVRKGQRIACLSTPRPEFWISVLAAARIGAVWVGLNPRHTGPELAHVLADSAPVLLLALASHRDRDLAAEIAALATANPGMAIYHFGGPAPTLPDLLAMAARTDDAALAAATAAVQTMDPAAIVYTSGSTGKPKGALLPHRGLSLCSHQQNRAWGARHGQTRIINYFPVNHLACLGDVSCFALVAGGTLIWMEDFDPVAVLSTVAAERVTVLGGVPTMIQMITAQPGYADADLSALETIAIGGAATPLPLVRQLRQRFARVSTGYGSTETIGHMTFTAPEAPDEQVSGSIGLPVPEYALRIALPDDRSCWPGEEGEIQVSGDFLFLGYHNNPQATAEAFTPDGWYRTGDAAVAQDDGTWRLVGRLKDVFKSGGYNIYPREIEIALEEHPAVSLAAVINVPDPLYGEVGHAFVVAAPGAAADEAGLLAHCRERLANYKIPKRAFVVDALPLLPVGKVDKPSLRARAAQAAAPAPAPRLPADS